MRIEYPRPLFYASTKKRQVLVNEDDAGELYRWYPPNEKRNNRDAVKNVYLSVKSTETTFTIEQKSVGFLKEQDWLVTENEREIGEITVPNSLNSIEHRLNGRLNVQDASIYIEIKAEKLRKRSHIHKWCC
ncbi:hypothetical protein JOC54_002708 [Alkalihalobacillus xiaoxiensis]|uniref:Uncharacterized protein n=1 Tax=Shouchella xiaoxiensis TaxID=766895 RepID=A0ABS2SV98_9BACI|nr:hypothetical protein [Shouchella xiaoxiensis]MBM7839428.1 hypothetical protein [Shouchella xiaoxiensis]